MRASLRFAPVFVCLGLFAVACGDDTGGAGGSDGSGGDSTASNSASGTEATTSTGEGGSGPGTGTGGEGPAECEFPAPITVDERIQEFVTFRGTAVDADGQPLVAEPVQVCGINICLFETTNANGEVTVAQGEDPLDTPLFKVGDGLVRAKIGYSLPEGDEPQVDGTTIDLVDSGTALATGASAEADGVVLTIADDAAVGLNLLEFGGAGEDTFRAAVVPSNLTDTIAPGEGFAIVVALGPHETLFCPSAAIEIPNDTDLAAGTAVEIVQQGLEIGSYFTEYGTWERVALGHVSDDGATIVTDEGQGLPILSSIGVRALD